MTSSPAPRQKNVTIDLDAILALEAEVRGNKTDIDRLRAERNAISAGFKTAAPEEKAELGRRAKEAGAKASELEAGIADKEAELKDALLRLPNIPWDGAPVGPDENSNVVIRTEGTLPDFGFTPRDHVELCEMNDWADLGRIVQVSGSRQYCLKGRLALLEANLMAWALTKISAAGFTPITVPALVREEAFVRQGQFPGHKEETYQLPNDDLWLAGTAEVALTSLHSGEILDLSKGPVRYAGYSPCFRREAGSAGRDVRGLLRVHQFAKVEQFVICEADEAVSADWHAKLLGLAEELLTDLEIPYQVIETSTGDMGLGKYRMNDIESWVPSPRQISRDAQLLDPARLAGPPRQPPLPRCGRQGALRPHPQQHRAGEPAHPRAAAGESPDRRRPRAPAQGAARADGRRVALSRSDTKAPPGYRRLTEALSLAPRILNSFGHLGPRGPVDGPPALVIPGFVATDRTTMELRRAFAAAGWRTHPWSLGLNRGARADTLERLERRLLEIGDGEPVLVIGWSLGGLFARELARHRPDLVSAVVTLGSPFSGDVRGNNVWRFYEMGRGPPRRQSADPAHLRQAAGPDARLLVAPRRHRRPRLRPRRSRTRATSASNSRCNHMAFGVSRPVTRDVTPRDTRRFLEARGLPTP